MTGIRLLFPLVFLGLCLATARAQVDVRLTMARNNFVAGETIQASVNVTNQSGQDLVFQGSSRVGWLDVMVNTLSGNPLTPIGQPAFGSVKIPLGQSMSRTIDLGQIYPLQAVGNYSVYVSVRLPGQGNNAVNSNRLLFNVNSARPYWSQKIGLPGKPGEGREYRVLEFNNGSKTMLYAQVANSRTGSAMRTHPLGEVLMFRKPSVTLDNRQVMHILYLMSPDMWGHVRVASDGQLLGRELHKRGGRDPVLFTSKDGIVEVGNSIPYDPKAEAEARGRVRKASDRPSFIFN
jgi:hypothetical protein